MQASLLEPSFECEWKRRPSGLGWKGLAGVNAERLQAQPSNAETQIRRAVLLVEVVHTGARRSLIQITVNQCGVRLQHVGELNNMRGVGAPQPECIPCCTQGFQRAESG